MISAREESVYNSYLYASRTSKNKPFRPRRDFAKMEDQDMIYLKKATAFLQRYIFIIPVKRLSAIQRILNNVKLKIRIMAMLLIDSKAVYILYMITAMKIK